MAERTLKENPMPTIWRVLGELWERIEPILQRSRPVQKYTVSG